MSDVDEQLAEARDDRERDPTKDQVEALDSQQRDVDEDELEAEEHEPQVATAHYVEVVERAGAILRGQTGDSSDLLGLTAHEQLALDLLLEAASGVDLSDERELLAEDRLALLNYGLALLQPILAMGLMPELIELRDDYDRLVVDVIDLRERLEKLEGAQEEKAPQEREEGAASDEDDEPDEPDDKADDKHKQLWAKKSKAGRPAVGIPVPAGEPERGTVFGTPGEPAVEKEAVPSTVFGTPGDPAVERSVAPTTLIGKPGEPAVEKPSLPSTAWDGPDAREKR